MIFTQPVIYEFEHIRVKTLFLIGVADRTAPGSNRAPPDVAARLGNYPELAHRAVRMIPNARFIGFPELGHAPQVEEPEALHKALLAAFSPD
jgi:pimeloyl-ACP methyl ester carboxylesterase